ncbi:MULTISPECIES: YfgM family protein [Erwinia]|uniref:Ancillary SecYEG translocon subunit n=1 Tax=Erwinia rhapontici TaxID=55212 RepID=A0ABN6DN71_ERWRD|nr:YfgM family protein [Erwinia rhapontici]NNS07143.1 YfgM family protein [Erwinia sp. JH02]MBP2157066.1 putative negative regulator of RcsB-dependent stress response [Erwinia rhapontici]MCS3608966.1 putative negative regulator of RcsB-dependent stress response [Erwinia rhapontici]NKG32552.1 tetratricopeptide repeat protein [Erwinia rhapontici]TDS97253.1 putative negative regulator of RcsB-dependent stress response [Erwinia rhapontici]
MEVYSNENEQVDALKNFFAQNGKALVVGVVLGVGALLGWRYWSNHQDSGSREVSASYQQVTSALDATKPASLDAVAKFASENSNTYGALASLDLAKRYIDNNQLDKAVDQLQSGLKSTKDANLQSVLNLRLARIQLQQKQPDAVLKTLESVKGDGWAAIVADVRGEALLSKGDVKGARDAWSKGIASDASSTLKEMLQMKVNNLPG